ncbi:MAG: hypothetical protein HY660_02315 [Armatimonadetes bacterium]|nr:hypothetical protein [Armatimonadota bacterium]
MGMRQAGGRRLLVGIGFLIVMGIVATAGFSAPMQPDMGMMAGNQLKTAIEHAKLAAGADALAGVKSHLQHVVNCIEGPRGAMYKGMGGNPCQGQGKGLLPDAKAAGMKYEGLVPWIDLANNIAAIGLKATTPGKAKAAAWAVQATLEQTEKSMMMMK